MNSVELRAAYLKFFEDRGHTVKPSFSLIPEDPTLLFTVAGMVPFKNYFLGKAPLIFTRATTSQKCIRTNDIENVGRTRRHHTFFEMLGHFSFGDYFKEEAIKWIWEFLTETVKLPKEKLYITVYLDDDDAYEIWNKKMKVPADRIFRLGKDTNFWEMGPVGPCGYCSEIYFDFESEKIEKVTAKDIETNDDRFLEICNSVFTEFDKQPDGKLKPLAQKNIDFGMGLERLAVASQGVRSNFETDLFMPVIKDASERTGIKYGADEKTDISLRVIADHARGVTFLIGDGVLPSNEGRGYVLRRIIRRAVRHGRLLGLKEPFLCEVVPVVAEIMKRAYPEIADRKEYIMQIIKLEEDKFQETIDKGMNVIEKEMKELLPLKSESRYAGMAAASAFMLYDTFGFPIELTEEIFREKGMTVDRDEFNRLMDEQKEKARKAWKGTSSELTAKLPEQALENIPVTLFTGYDALLEPAAKVIAVIKGKARVKSADAGSEVIVILDKTPMYAMSGGQCGDKGVMESGAAAVEVNDTQKIDEVFVHMSKVSNGTLREGDTVKVSVNTARRSAIAKNHTGTHLLQAALRSVLGPHVEQAGSYVGEDRLRFDFTHYSQLSAGDIKVIEKLVNRWAQSAEPVITEEMEFAKAREMGAMALFEEKYKAKVRTVTVAGISMELCGGTHLKNTGEIGMFKITASYSTAAGIRRIEAITGGAALEMMEKYEDFINSLRDRFKSADTAEIEEKISKMAVENREMEKEIQNLKKADVLKDVDAYVKNAKDINGVKVIVLKFTGADKETVRSLGDILKQKVKKAVIVIANIQEDKVAFLSVVTDDLTEKFDASKIVKAVAAVCKGGGGGRRDMAEAGGKDASKTDDALKLVEELAKG